MHIATVLTVAFVFSKTLALDSSNNNQWDLTDHKKYETKSEEISGKVELPSSLDWRKKNAVTAVQLENEFPSWISSAAGAIEGLFAIKTHTLKRVSRQNIKDCWKTYCSNCTESPATAFKFIERNGGVNTEDTYIHHGPGICYYDPKGSIGKIRGYTTIPSGDEMALQLALANIGPISVTINGNPLLSYTGGVYKGDCDQNHRNTSLLVVGYDTDSDGTEFWILKNFMGKSWGENGYIRLIRNRNQCGISNAAVYPYA